MRMVAPAPDPTNLARIAEYELGREDYLFPSLEGRSDYPVSRSSFRTRVWLPATPTRQASNTLGPDRPPSD